MHYTDNPLHRYARDKTAPTPGSDLDALYAGFASRLTAAALPADYASATLIDGPAEVTATTSGARKHNRYELREYLTQYIRSFAKEADGGRIKSLYLYSAEKGVGKTTTAAAILIEYLAASYLRSTANGETPAQAPAYFLDVNEWQTLYNGFNRGHVPADRAERISAEYYRRFDRAQYARFAVLDDIGVRDATDAFRGDLHTIINHRCANGLPTVYTSNIALTNLAGVFDERLADRVRDQCLEVKFLDTQSKRGVRK